MPFQRLFIIRLFAFFSFINLLAISQLESYVIVENDYNNNYKSLERDRRSPPPEVTEEEPSSSPRFGDLEVTSRHDLLSTESSENNSFNPRSISSESESLDGPQLQPLCEGGHSSALLYHSETGRCWEVGALESDGPCGRNMMFYHMPGPNDLEFGFCDCIRTEPAVYHEKLDECVVLYRQEYCQPGYWLTLNETTLVVECTPNPCGQNETASVDDPEDYGDVIQLPTNNQNQHEPSGSNSTNSQEEQDLSMGSLTRALAGLFDLVLYNGKCAHLGDPCGVENGTRGVIRFPYSLGGNDYDHGNGSSDLLSPLTPTCQLFIVEDRWLATRPPQFAFGIGRSVPPLKCAPGLRWSSLVENCQKVVQIKFD